MMIAPMVLGLGVFFYLALGASFFVSLTEWDVLERPQVGGVWKTTAPFSPTRPFGGRS